MDLLHYVLEREGLTVLRARTGREALSVVRSEQVNLVVLDSTLPDLGGLTVLNLLRGFSQVPVIMLASSMREEDAIAGLQCGADDYVAKPFSVQVFIYRIAAVLRRTRGLRLPLPRRGTVYHAGTFIFDSGLNEVLSEDVHVELTPTESHILHLLLLHAGHPLPAERIIEHVWGDARARSSGVVKTHIKRLRRKIKALPHSPEAIYTVPHAGYMVKHGDELSRHRSQARDGEDLVAVAQ
jgi:two-component system alkaline phosphatase synthesis response regulator PhoP